MHATAFTVRTRSYARTNPTRDRNMDEQHGPCPLRYFRSTFQLGWSSSSYFMAHCARSLPFQSATDLVATGEKCARPAGLSLKRLPDSLAISTSKPANNHKTCGKIARAKAIGACLFGVKGRAICRVSGFRKALGGSQELWSKSCSETLFVPFCRKALRVNVRHWASSLQTLMGGPQALLFIPVRKASNCKGEAPAEPV